MIYYNFILFSKKIIDRHKPEENEFFKTLTLNMNLGEHECED